MDPAPTLNSSQTWNADTPDPAAHLPRSSRKDVQRHSPHEFLLLRFGFWQRKVRRGTPRARTSPSWDCRFFLHARKTLR